MLSHSTKAIKYYSQHGFNSFCRYSHTHPDLSIFPFEERLVDDVDRIVSNSLQFRLELFPQLQTLRRDQDVRFEVASR